jgi:hypothetical protein
MSNYRYFCYAKRPQILVLLLSYSNDTFAKERALKLFGCRGVQVERIAA